MPQGSSSGRAIGRGGPGWALALGCRRLGRRGVALGRLALALGSLALALGSLALALGSLAWTGVAYAERVSTLVLPGSHAGPEAEATVENALGRALAEQDLDVVDGFALARRALAEGAVPERDLVPFQRATVLLEEGWRSYLEVRASFAAARLAEARTAALAVAPLDGGRDLVAEISLRLGVVKLDLQRSAEAGDDFRLAHMLAPDRAVTDAEFKPEAVAAYAAALAAPSTLSERSLPTREGVRFWIDGTEVFGASVELSEGLHMVEAKAIGFRSRARLISVSPGASVPVAMDLEPDPVATRALAGRQGFALGSAESDARLVASAVLLYSQTERLLLAASVWRRGEPALLGQRCLGQPARCSAVVEIGYPAGGVAVAATELLRALEGSPLRFPPTLQVDSRLVSGESRPGDRETKPRQALWKNRWLWVGAAAAAVAGGAVYLLAEPDEGKPIFTGDTCEFGGC